MFGLGMSSLAWMAVLTGVMVVEKTYPGGQRLSPIIGISLLALATCGWFILRSFRWLKERVMIFFLFSCFVVR